MSSQTKPSLENLVESGVLGVESLHPGGMTTTKELAELCRVNTNTSLLDVASGTGESTCFLVKTFGCTAGNRCFRNNGCPGQRKSGKAGIADQLPGGRCP